MLKYITPTSLIGKLALWGFFYVAGYATAYKYMEREPTTQIVVEQKNKAKKNSTVAVDLKSIVDQSVDTQQTSVECEDWLRGLKPSEVRKIRRNK